MSLINFESITNLFSNHDSDSEHKQLLQEVLLVVLARAAKADTNVNPDEVTLIQEILADVSGAEVSSGDVRTAADSALFERQSLERYLSKATRRLHDDDRTLILSSLTRVLNSDGHIREFEIDYFDRVANALKATPSEIAGLKPGPVR